MDVLLCSMSAKRLAMIEEDPGVLADLISERHEVDIPGLFDLGKTWHALDIILGEGTDPVLGDAVMARSGTKLKTGSKLQARMIAPPRVALVSKALGELGPTTIREKYATLYGKQVHGNYGQEICEPHEVAYIRDSVKKIHAKEMHELEMALAGVTALYAAAVTGKMSMMSLIV